MLQAARSRCERARDAGRAAVTSGGIASGNEGSATASSEAFAPGKAGAGGNGGRRSSSSGGGGGGGGDIYRPVARAITGARYCLLSSTSLFSLSLATSNMRRARGTARARAHACMLIVGCLYVR